MNDGVNRPCLSAVLVDYDNIYLSLRRKNEDAAKRFAKDSGHWLNAIAKGDLITTKDRGSHYCTSACASI